MTRTRVLIVDDERAILRSTELLLESMGFEVAAVSEARGIVDAAKRLRPHVILQDVRMPGLDLDAVVKQLREDPALRLVPLVLFSASIDAGEIAQRVGAAACVEKPFTVDELREALRAAAA